jgi:hypothetical protein
MSNITRFDVTEHIRAKVRETLIAAIPDDEMDKMIEAEFHQFFREQRDYPGASPKPSQFQLSVRKVLWEEMEGALKSWITRYLNKHWEAHGETALKELVSTYVMEQMIKRAFESLGYSVWVNK